MVTASTHLLLAYWKVHAQILSSIRLEQACTPINQYQYVSLSRSTEIEDLSLPAKFDV